MTLRKILIGVGVVAVVVIGALVWLGSNLDGLIEQGVERYGSRITGTDVSLAGVDFAVREGRGTFDDLRVANPERFSDESALRFGEIVLDVDPGTIRREPIVIETISVRDPVLRLEVTETGGVNLREIRERVSAYGAAGSSPADAGGGDPPPRVSVKRFSIEGGTIVLDATAAGGEQSERELGGFTLENLGGSDGVPADRLGREALDAILRQALEGGALEELKRRAGDVLEEKAGELLEGLGGE